MTIANKSVAHSAGTAALPVAMQQQLLDSQLFDDFDMPDVDDGFDADVNEFMDSHGFGADDFH